ncbi:unnamed protein product [Rotaria sp. Silwood2]|nr:unnamed protein product [Rotaria sp. Silwood2]
MSRTHFLTENSKKIFSENIHLTQISSPDSLSQSRQSWRYLVQYILNNKLYLEHKLLQFDLNSNVFQRYQHQFTKEYKIEESERIFKIYASHLRWLPSRETIKSISIQIASILRYPNIYVSTDHTMIIPLIAQFGIVMIFSEIENITEREQNKLRAHNYVTNLVMPGLEIESLFHDSYSFKNDNDVGEEYYGDKQPILRQRFRNYFDQTIALYRQNDIEYLELDIDMFESYVDDKRAAIMKQTQNHELEPNLILSGDSHHFYIFLYDRINMTTRILAREYLLQTIFSIDLNRNRFIYEISVPTYSYRMGVIRIGYIVLLLDSYMI